MQVGRPISGDDLVDLLRVTGPLPRRLVAVMAPGELLEELEREELLVAAVDDDVVELGPRAGTAAVSGLRRRRLLAVVATALEDEPLGRVAPDVAVRVASAVVEVGGRSREPLVRGIRAALVLGQMDEAARLAAHARATFVDDLEVAHLVAMTYEATGRHGSATAVMAGIKSDPASLGRWWSNLFLSLRGEGVVPDISGIGDQHNELLANQAWIEIVAGDVAAVARSTTTILNDPASSPQAVVWACVAGAMAAALDGRADVVVRLFEHAEQIVAAAPEWLTPFAPLQLDLVRFLSDVRLGHIVAACEFADARIAAASSTFLASVWQAMSGLALRECGQFDEGRARLSASLPAFTGDNFGLITWAHSEARVCLSLIHI